MIRYATESDYKYLTENDRHILPNELKYAIKRRRILIYDDGGQIAFARYNLFWDNTPFCNMLFVSKPHRNKGIGKSLVTFWENEMKQSGYNTVMTSTRSDEEGQLFWRKIGYTDCGSFKTDGEPTELLFYKRLK